MRAQTDPDPDTTALSLADSAALYAACSHSDPRIQTQAFETLWPYLYTVAFHVVRDQPEAQDLAQDCAQNALIQVHKRLADCREPAAFRTWARRIASNTAIDALRRRRRLVPLPDEEADEAGGQPLPDESPPPEAQALTDIGLSELRTLLNQAPISDRSRRTVMGRYLDDQPDELLAQVESDLAQQAIRPSHVQVTRAKNMAKLREWETIQVYLEG